MVTKLCSSEKSIASILDSMYNLCKLPYSKKYLTLLVSNSGRVEFGWHKGCY